MAESLPEAIIPAQIGDPDQKTLIVDILEGYRTEGVSSRESGENPRDEKWKENLDLYWNRYDYSKKADWQSKAVMPEVPQFVDRFAAAMRDALGGNGDYYIVLDPADANNNMARAIKRMMDVWLSRCGRLPTGQFVGFPAVFGELMKVGALMNIAATVTWKIEDGEGYVAVETVDPRRVWVDALGRNLYRVRRIEMDKHQLMALARTKDGSGKSLYDLDEIKALAAWQGATEQEENARRTGDGQIVSSNRKPILVDEYLCDLIRQDGELLAENVLCVVANEKFLIRGPEKNPFWHKRDWLLTTPLITVPLSVYGKGYMENMAPLARLFTDFTNLIMDATYSSSIKAFVADPSKLLNPADIDKGLSPNLMLKTEDDVDPRMVIHTVDLGMVPQDVLQVWSAIKNELREAGMFNEIGVGQLAPKSRTSATEIGAAQMNSGSMVRDLARTVEERFLEPLLDLVWKTGLQHMDPNDGTLRAAAGEEMFQAIYANRKEMMRRPITFQVRGISTMVMKSQKLREILQIMGVVFQNPITAQAFMQRVAPDKLLDMVFTLGGVDIDKLSLTPLEKQMQALQQQAAPPGVPGEGPSATPQQVVAEGRQGGAGA